MEIQSFLLNVGYKGNVSEQIFKEGPLNSIFIDVIVWLNSELVKLCELKSLVSRDTNTGDYHGFFGEVSSLLRELFCPYKCLTKANVSERYIRPEHKKLLIIYLCTELQAAKLQTFKNLKKKSMPMKIKLDVLNAAKKLKEILIYLHFPMPPETVPAQQIFEAIEKRLKQLSQSSMPKEKVGELLFTECLTEKQWFQLEYLYKEMYEEYKVRKDLLLIRLDVTVKSFCWSERLKEKIEEIMNIYEKYKSGILLNPMVKISDILAAKPNLTFAKKTSSVTVRKNTKSFINSVVIGVVPDRGGRPEEQSLPPHEVPSWKKRNLAPREGQKPPLLVSKGYCKKNANKKHGSAPQKYSRSHASIGYFAKKVNISRGNYGLGNEIFPIPVYQPVKYDEKYEHFEFGGYMPAGNDYQEYGIIGGVRPTNQINCHQTRTLYRGSRLRHKSENSNGGWSQSRNG